MNIVAIWRRPIDRPSRSTNAADMNFAVVATWTIIGIVAAMMAIALGFGGEVFDPGFPG